LLFGDPVIVTEPTGTPESVQTRHEYLRTAAKLDELWLKAAQTAAGLGWCYLAVTFDSTLFSRPIPFVVRPQDADPTFGPGGELLSLTIKRTLSSTAAEEKDGVVWRHHQTHLPGRVVHALFKGTTERLGDPVDLASHPATRTIRIDGQHESGYAETLTGYPGISATIWRNRIVADGWMAKDPLGVHLGVSDFDGIRGIFDQIDARLSGLADSFDDGQGRAVVPSDWIEWDPDQPGAGGVFNLNRKVFTGVDMGGRNSDQRLEMLQFEFRSAEYLQTIDSLSVKAVTMAGYSAYTFGYTDGVAQTATEIEARTAETRSLRAEKIRLAKTAVEEFLACFYALDAHYWPEYGGAATVATVEWPAAVSLTIGERATLAAAMSSSESGSTMYRVMTLHGWAEDDPRLAPEVGRVLAESGRAVVPVDDYPA
jgi:hypothetical protein